MRGVKFFIALIMAFGMASVEAETPPFALAFDGVLNADDVLTVAAGGWPLSLKATIAEGGLVDIGGFDDHWNRPSEDWQVLLVTEDPDGCPSWWPGRWRDQRAKGAPAAGRCQLEASEFWRNDETMIKVRPGFQSPSLALEGEQACSERPRFWHFKQFDREYGGANLGVVPFGPCAGNGYGYGRNPRLPSLVLLADQGPGLVVDVSFEVLTPLRSRNLAGFFTSVGFTWRDAGRKREISLHTLAPPGLFSSVVAVDTDVTFPPWYSGLLWLGDRCNEMRSIDGGLRFCFDSEPVLDSPTRLRAFLVEGEAPTELADQDGNGVLNAQDAVLAGFRLLSNEAELSVIEVFGRRYIDIDLDGDGKAATYPFPGSPVDLTEPPP